MSQAKSTSTKSKLKSKSGTNFESDEISRGTFLHYRKKKRTFFYEDFLKKKDPYYHHLDVGTECETNFRGENVHFKGEEDEIFFHVVDLDSFEYHKIVFHTYLNSVLQSAWFRFSILALVLLSSVMIGMSTSDNFKEYDNIMTIIDQIIMSVFIFEIAVKWMYDFRLFWKVWWNVLDFVIVLFTVVTGIFPLSSEGNGSKAIVIVRVVRAFRTLKSISSLSSLQIVSRTVFKAWADLGNILLVLMIFMLVMAVMGTIIFDFEPVKSGTKWFMNGLEAWWLLFICVTQDGWNQALSTFKDDMGEYFHALAIYLIIAVSVGAFIFANLIVAVIVANLELAMRERREEQLLSDDPLDTESGFIIDELDIIPTYRIFADNTAAMLSQRPMKIPSLKHISLRRLQSYITMVVALEQNMLEAELIYLDFEKVVAVILSIMLQLDVYSAPVNEKEKEEGAKVLNDLKRFSLLDRKRPQDAIDRMEQATAIQKIRKKQASIKSAGTGSVKK